MRDGDSSELDAHEVRRELATLRAERDKLKAALKDLLDDVNSEGTNMHAINNARAVLAKTKTP